MVRLAAVSGRPHALRKEEARIAASGRSVVVPKNTTRAIVIGARPPSEGDRCWTTAVCCRCRVASAPEESLTDKQYERTYCEQKH